MKTSFFKFILLAGTFFSGSAVLDSCSKADAIKDINSPDAHAMVAPNSQAQGTDASVNPATADAPSLFNNKMKVTYANSDGMDITNTYDGYTFVFEDNGNGSGAVYGYDSQGATQTGKWYYMSPEGSKTMNIVFDKSTDQYNFLVKDWRMTTSKNEVILKSGSDISPALGETGSSREIHFAKM